MYPVSKLVGLVPVPGPKSAVIRLIDGGAEAAPGPQQRPSVECSQIGPNVWPGSTRIYRRFPNTDQRGPFQENLVTCPLRLGMKLSAGVFQAEISSTPFPSAYNLTTGPGASAWTDDRLSHLCTG